MELALLNVLTINAGSSSLKFRLYKKERLVLIGMVDKIGPDAELITKTRKKINAKSHVDAAQVLLGLIKKENIDLIIYRIVHGGDLTRPTIINKKTIKKLESLCNLAPLHLPASLSIINFFNKRLNVKSIACFDTMFHRAMPDKSRLYSLPKNLCDKHSIERYGFHGLAHEAMAMAVSSKMKKPLSSLRIITCQIGNGVSLCAIKNGISIDTTMGFTPLEGLMMGTRSGSIDPSIVEFLCTHEKMSPKKVLEILEKKSGLYGIAQTNDVRDLLSRKDKQARLALEMFAYKIRMQIGAYIAALNGVDAIVLGGGVSQSPIMRKKFLENMESFGIVIDKKTIARAQTCKISRGLVQIWVMDADEEGHMLKLVKRFK